MGGSRHKRRRNAQPTPLDLLLSDPGTVHAAADAFALAQRPDASAWPFVASVGVSTVTLRWAGGGGRVPEPEAPWRAGHDARVWIADRAEIGAGGPVAAVAAGGAVLVIGQFDETVVFVNTSRAPGPIAVGGAPDGEAGLLRELIARQSRAMIAAGFGGAAAWADADRDGPTGNGAARGGRGRAVGGPSGGAGEVGRRGAWWPVEVEGDAIVLLGLAIARMFTTDEAQMACELIQRTALEDRATLAERQKQRQQQSALAGHEAGHETQQVGPDGQVGSGEYVEKWRKLGYVEDEDEAAFATPAIGTVGLAAGHAVGLTTGHASDDALADWLRQVKAAAAQVQEPVPEPMTAPESVAATLQEPVAEAADSVDVRAQGRVQRQPSAPAAAASTSAAMDAGSSVRVPMQSPAQTPMVAGMSASAPTPVPTPTPVPVSTPVPVAPSAPAAAPRPVPAPAPTPAPVAEDDADDWAAGFAVSSAEESAHR